MDSGICLESNCGSLALIYLFSVQKLECWEDFPFGSILRFNPSIFRIRFSRHALPDDDNPIRLYYIRPIYLELNLWSPDIQSIRICGDSYQRRSHPLGVDGPDDSVPAF
jgi:hypothetical protein